jgi:hypothetical protein
VCFVFILFLSFLNGAISKEDELKIREHFFGKDVKLDSEKSKDQTVKSHERDKNSYLYEIIYEKVKKNKQNNAHISNAQIASKLLFDNVTHQENIQKELEQKAKELEQASTKSKAKKIHLTGYCSFKNDVEVGVMKAYATINCEFSSKSEIKRAKLMLSLTPDAKLKALIGTPIYVNANEDTYDVLSGVIMTADQTSLNLANFVNDTLLKELAARSLMATGNVAYTQSIAYLEAKKQAAQTEEVVNTTTTDANGNQITTPVKTTNYEDPKASDYITTGLVTLGSSLVKLFGQAYLEQIKYTFKIYKTSQVHVDLVVQNQDIQYDKSNQLNIQTPNNNSGLQLNNSSE